MSHLFFAVSLGFLDCSVDPLAVIIPCHESQPDKQGQTKKRLYCARHGHSPGDGRFSTLGHGGQDANPRQRILQLLSEADSLGSLIVTEQIAEA